MSNEWISGDVGSSGNAAPIKVNTEPEREVYTDHSESVEDVSRMLRDHLRFLRWYREQNPEQGAGASRTVSSREQAHWAGRAYSRLNGEQEIFALLGHKDLQRLEGKLLTLVDAAFPDREQRKAVKNLIRDTIWDEWVPYLDTDAGGGRPNLHE